MEVHQCQSTPLSIEIIGMEKTSNFHVLKRKIVQKKNQQNNPRTKSPLRHCEHVEHDLEFFDECDMEVFLLLNRNEENSYEYSHSEEFIIERTSSKLFD